MPNYSQRLDNIWDDSVELSTKHVRHQITQPEELTGRLELLKRLDAVLIELRHDVTILQEARLELEERIELWRETFLLAVGQSLYHMNQFTAAIAACRDCLRRNPYRFEAWEQLLEALEKLNEKEAIEAELQQIPTVLANAREGQFGEFLLALCQRLPVPCPRELELDAKAAIEIDRIRAVAHRQQA